MLHWLLLGVGSDGAADPKTHHMRIDPRTLIPAPPEEQLIEERRVMFGS